jgi:D-sedoheptulose 7-phosphate isomerase
MLDDALTDFVDAYLNETVSVLTDFRDDPAFREIMTEMADIIVASLRAGGKLLACGNGGSAGDAQHIAGEFVARLMYDRAPLAAIALTTDSSVLTATGNDYGYDYIFERQVLALGRPGDVLLGISTSGTSPNVLRAFEAAKRVGVICIGFSGNRPNTPMHELCDRLLAAPSGKTAIIQQVHIVAAHVICALVESTMFPRD